MGLNRTLCGKKHLSISGGIVLIKRILLFYLSLIVAVGVSGCLKGEKAKKLVVTAGEQEIQSFPLKVSDGDNENERKNTFTYLFEQNEPLRIEYIKIREKIILDFGDNPPDNIMVEDSILNSEGKYLFNEKETMNVPIIKEDDKYFFLLKGHKASTLSSRRNITVIRGFKITAYWKDQKYEYAIVIEADSMYPSHPYIEDIFEIVTA